MDIWFEFRYLRVSGQDCHGCILRVARVDYFGVLIHSIRTVEKLLTAAGGDSVSELGNAWRGEL